MVLDVGGGHDKDLSLGVYQVHLRYLELYWDVSDYKVHVLCCRVNAGDDTHMGV